MKRYYELSKAPFNPDINYKSMALLAMQGNETCKKIFSDMSAYLGTALSTLINILPVEVIVIYGSLIDIRDAFDEKMMEIMKKHSYGNKTIEVIYSELDMNAPAIGAAIWTSNLFINSIKF